MKAIELKQSNGEKIIIKKIHKKILNSVKIHKSELLEQ